MYQSLLLLLLSLFAVVMGSEIVLYEDQFIEGSRCERYVFAVAVDITLGSARDSRGVASIREAVSRVRAQREKTLRKPNIVCRPKLDSREAVTVQRVLLLLVFYTRSRSLNNIIHIGLHQMLSEQRVHTSRVYANYSKQRNRVKHLIISIIKK